MIRRPTSTALAATLSLAALAGCAPDDTQGSSPASQGADANTSISRQGLIDGFSSFDRPEVGYIQLDGGLCTATLIRPNVALTAAHCVDFRSIDGQGQPLGVFVLELGEREGYGFYIDAYLSLGDDLGATDLALLHLSDAVPPQLATPAEVADRSATGGEDVEWYGYGCGRRDVGGDAWTGIKQKLAFPFQMSANSCPGDSGGPTFIGDDGPVFRVTSGYYGGSGIDIFGDAAGAKAIIDEIADEWASVVETPEPVEPPAEDEAEPAPARAQITDAVTDGRLVYMEWVDTGATDYAQILIAIDDDGNVITYIYRIDGGEPADDGALYTYFQAQDLCAAAAEEGLTGTIRAVAQIWPDVDQSRAESRLVDQAIDCGE